MADLGKNGYSWTGYTEPFIVPEGVTINNGSPLRNAGSIPIEKTEYRNSVLYARADETNTGNTFISKDINFDTRSDVNTDAWILDIDGTEVTVTDVTYDNITGVYTVTVSSSVSVEDGKAYRVTKRNPDVAWTTASKTYTAGMRVVEPYDDSPPT